MMLIKMRSCETVKERNFFRGREGVYCFGENSAKGVRKNHLKFFNHSHFSHLLAVFSQLSKDCISPVENTWFFAISQFGHRFLRREFDDVA